MNKNCLNKVDKESYNINLKRKTNYSNQKCEKDSEKKPNDRDIHDRNSNTRIYTKRNILILFIPLIIFFNLYLINNNPTFLELTERIKKLEFKIKTLEKKISNKKIGIAFVYRSLHVNRVARYLTVLSDLLVKTGKYDVYLINEMSTEFDFHYNKKIKRIVQNINFQTIKDLDENNNIEIYILNNEISELTDIFKSFGKKVIGIYHAVYFSPIYNNDTLSYRSWKIFSKYDSFIHTIPDDYYLYKKLGFTNSIYMPNINTFDSNLTPSSNLVYKNLLIVGSLYAEIKGVKYGLLAMAEILKKVPEAKLTILGLNYPEYLKNLAKELGIGNSVYWPGFSTNITEYYLNTSVLLIPAISGTSQTVINEGKAHGLPIVAFNIDYEPSLQSGVILVEMLDYKGMARKAIKLLNNYEYRRKKGEEAKLSLNNYLDNNGIIDMWNRLFRSLIITDDYKELQEEVENKYYNEDEAKYNLEKHYHYAQQYNPKFRCHSFENMTNLSYINNIEECPL